MQKPREQQNKLVISRMVSGPFAGPRLQTVGSGIQLRHLFSLFFSQSQATSCREAEELAFHVRIMSLTSSIEILRAWPTPTRLFTP